MVLALCRYINNLLEEETYVASYPIIIRAYDCLMRWSILGQWIKGDKTCMNAVIGTLCRGVGIMDSDADYAHVSDATVPSPSHDGLYIAIQTLLLESNPGVSLAESKAGSNSSSLSSLPEIPQASPEKDKRKSTKPAVKLFTKPHSRSQSAGAQQAAVSTGSKDGGVGLPTFATLSAEISIKTTAEIYIAQFMNDFGNFPPFGEVVGVSKMSTLWNEFDALRKLIIHRQFEEMKRASIPLNMNVDKSTDITELRKLIKFYAYDNRVIIGVMEQPAWMPSDPHNNTVASAPASTMTSIDELRQPDPPAIVQPPLKNPAVTLILRDSTGKYSWTSFLKYLSDQEDWNRMLKRKYKGRGWKDTGSNERASFRKTSTSAPTGMLIDASDLKRHFNPPRTPYLTDDRVVHPKGVNDDKIPDISQVGMERTDSAKELETFKTLTQRQINEEETRNLEFFAK